jgi:hypothetical protein
MELAARALSWRTVAASQEIWMRGVHKGLDKRAPLVGRLGAAQRICASQTSDASDNPCSGNQPIQ